MAAILSFDATGADCSVAVLSGGGTLVARMDPIGRGHSEYLPVMIREVMAFANMTPKRLDRIVTTTGPGGFTGVRVGTAYARGLALALGVPAVGVSGLAVLAMSAQKAGARRIAAVHDAKRGDLVLQGFDGDMALGPAERLDQEAAEARLAEWGDGALVGAGAQLLETAAWPDWGVRRINPIFLGEIGATLDPAAHPARPVYVRSPDAVPAAQPAPGS
ncbi:MAG: tRNA (adenosine(37)-N6)-threonylcarbamoyltransferase complex dimerization subunit type 1 TsaB [Maricaulaceae bacterium]